MPSAQTGSASGGANWAESRELCFMKSLGVDGEFEAGRGWARPVWDALFDRLVVSAELERR